MEGLLGLGFDDPQSQAIMALSGGLLGQNGSRGLGAGLLGASQAMQAAKAQALKEQMLRMQMEEVKAHADERKQKMALAERAQERQDRLLYGEPDGVSAGASAPSADGSVMPQGAAPQAGGIMALAQKYGIPPQAIQADIAFNGGKKVSELLAKHGGRDMQVANGYAYDKNQLGAGFMPFLNTSTTGQTSMGRIGPDGLPVVSAPRGAMETYQGYRRADEGTKADYDLQMVTPQGQNPQMTTRGALVRNPQVSGTQIAPGEQSKLDQGRVEILGQELTKAQAQLKSALQVGDMAAANRAATDVASLNRELGRAGGQSRATVGMPLQSKAEEVKAEATAKAAADRDAVMQKGAVTSADTMGYIKEARKLFEKGPTASGIGSVVDSAASLFGKSTPGADAAAQLDTLSGWMVANVPRMEGPQSNFDVQNYKTMAGMVGDKTKPLSQRMAALDTLEKLQKKYEHLNGGGEQQPNQSGGTTDGWGIKKVN